MDVKKPGPNLGRKFYSCTDYNCKGFVWADNVPRMEVQSPLETSKSPQDKVWEDKDRRMARMACHKVAAQLVVVDPSDIASGDMVSKVIELAHVLEQDIYRSEEPF